MAYSSVAPGVGYKDPHDLNDPVFTPEDSEFVAKTVAARLMELGASLGEVRRLVELLGSMSRVSPQSPVDAQTAALIAQLDSLTHQEIVRLLQDAAGLHADKFGVKADGITDDTAALMAGLAESARLGLPLHLPVGARVRVAGTLRPPSGSTLDGRGGMLVWDTNTGPGSWLVSVSNTNQVVLRDVALWYTGPTSVDQRGLAAVNATNLTVERVTVGSDQMGMASVSINALGMLFDGCYDLHLSDLFVTKCDNGVRIKACHDVDLNGLQVHNCRLGLWLSNLHRFTARKGLIKARTDGTVEGNGVLIDGNLAGDTDTITIEDFVVEDTAHTSFRIGGAVPVYRVSFVRCKSVRCRNNGFKTLGGEVNSNSWHRFIRFIDCEVIDCGMNVDSTNAAAVAVHLSKDVVVSNLIVRPEGGRSDGFSCRNGVYVAGSSRVSITNLAVDLPAYAGIYVGSALGDCADVTVDGARIATNNGGYPVVLTWTNVTFRRITMRGLSIEHYGEEAWVIAAAKSDTSDLVGGIDLEVQMKNVNPVTKVCTGTGRSDLRVEWKGLPPSDMSYTGFKDGSRWWGGASDSALGLRQGGAWRWL